MFGFSKLIFLIKSIWIKVGCDAPTIALACQRPWDFYFLTHQRKQYMYIKFRRQPILNNMLGWKLNLVEKLISFKFYFWWFVCSVSNNTFHPKAPKYFQSASHHNVNYEKRYKAGQILYPLSTTWERLI